MEISNLTKQLELRRAEAETQNQKFEAVARGLNDLKSRVIGSDSSELKRMLIEWIEKQSPSGK